MADHPYSAESRPLTLDLAELRGLLAEALAEAEGELGPAPVLRHAFYTAPEPVAPGAAPPDGPPGLGSLRHDLDRLRGARGEAGLGPQKLLWCAGLLVGLAARMREGAR